MQKIKIMTDSACDIDRDLELSLGIKILSFTVIMDGKDYRERIDFTNEEFYKMIDEAKEFPSTSQLTAFELQEAYQELFDQGYTDVIYVTIASKGSATHQNALMARDNFYDEVEGADKMKIHIVDSGNYTGVYGYPVIQAAKKLQRGASVEELVDYLTEWFTCSEVLFAPFTLKYVKRSGRVSAAAAFAGELLGLRPLIRITDGVSYVAKKVRGDKNIIPNLIELMESRMIPKTPYCIISGKDDTYADELAKELTKIFGYPPAGYFHIGAAVTINAGPDVVGVVIRAERNN